MFSNTKWTFLLLGAATCIASYWTYSVFTKPRPRVSIITSIWKGDEFMEGFLADITKQSMFSECELILVNPSSPGNEEPIILKYTEQFPNIKYMKLETDPGLYACWNYGIHHSTGEYITNANIDDRSSEFAIEDHVKILDQHPEVDLAYSAYCSTIYPNITFDDPKFQAICDPAEFSLKAMIMCLPGPRPMWRRSMHDRYGFFDESYTSAGDMDMWLRAVTQGSQFIKLAGVHTMFYHNPQGVSTNKDKQRAKVRDSENHSLYIQYNYLWQL